MHQASVGGFVECSEFAGSREGFVFKMGSEGLGYYPDRGMREPRYSTPERRNVAEEIPAEPSTVGKLMSGMKEMSLGSGERQEGKPPKQAATQAEA